MFAFALRLRRAKPQQRDFEVKKKSISVASLVIFGCFSCLFGLMFYFLEKIGNCHCNLDFYGVIMITFGTSIVLFHCVIDCYRTFFGPEDEEGEGADDVSDVTDSSSLDDPNDSPLYPKIISFNVCPEHDTPLVKNQSHIVFPCAKKSTVLIREYNLPSVVVEI